MIRKAEIKDINDLINLLHAVHDIHRDARPDIFKDGTTKYDKQDLKEIINDEKRPIFVYELNKKVVGYVFSIIKSIKNDKNLEDYDYLFIDDICVLEDYRDKGIGSELYSYVKKFAKMQKLKSIRLNVWNFNEKAYFFYKKQGMNVLEDIMEETL